MTRRISSIVGHPGHLTCYHWITGNRDGQAPGRTGDSDITLVVMTEGVFRAWQSLVLGTLTPSKRT